MTPYPLALARLSSRGVARFRTEHPWIYRAGIERVEEETGQEGLARVVDPKGRSLGVALLSRESQITLRLLTRSDVPVDRNFLRARIEAAVDYRTRIAPDRDAVRLVFGESDGLPGLVVDRYGPHLVCQFLNWGMNSLGDEVVAVLRDLLSPETILARNDPSVRTLEGLPRVVTPLHGDPPGRIAYREGSIELSADLREGQKTGAFLDQVENHLRVAELARGRVLDLFTYAGGFALHAAGGADQVTAVDSSAPSLELARNHAERNGITNVTWVEANAFDYLKAADRERAEFDLVVLDPPAFAKNKRELEGEAPRGYKEINLRAMKILAPGGILVTCSCSYHLSETLMDEVLSLAAADAHRVFRVRERRRQASDHPVRLGFPESLYLKCQILERVS